MSPSAAPPDGTRVALVVSPAERLALSRERLRQAMQPRNPAGASARGALGASSPGAWLRALKANPAAAILLDALARWWSQHPLRLAGMVAADATSAVVRPMAQRNPLGLVLGALLVGGALAWSRPWRWLVTPALLAGLVPQLFSKLMALVPPQSWMAVLAALTQEQRQEPPRQGQDPEPPTTEARPAADLQRQSTVAGSKNE